MTVEELEGKLTNIYHEFAETISENETDEQIVARSKEWFVKRLSEETDNKEAIESIANQLVGCLKQASVLSNLEKEKMISSLEKRYAFYKDGIVYQKPHIILEFSKRHDESIYFDSDEEMEGWFESFMEEFGKPFIYID